MGMMPSRGARFPAISAVGQATAAFATSLGTATDDYSGGLPNAVATTPKSVLAETVSVKRFGAKGDYNGSTGTDDTTAFQNALNSGAKMVRVPKGDYLIGSITIPAGTQLVGAWPGGIPGRYADNPSRLVAKAGTTGYLIDTEATTQKHGIVIHGLGLKGLGAGTALGGIRLRNCYRGQIISCAVETFADHGYYTDASCTAARLHSCFAQGCLQNRTRTQKDGVAHLLGNDNSILNCELSASMPSTKSDSNLYICGVVLGGANATISGFTVIEFNDVGIHIPGTFSAARHRIIGARSEFNCAYAIENLGGGSLFQGCHLINNGLDTDATYPAVTTSGSNGVRNRFHGVIAWSDGSQTNRPSYAFADSAGNPPNEYLGCFGFNMRTADYNITSTAIVWDANFLKLPTASAGLASGRVWLNSNVLTVIP